MDLEINTKLKCLDLAIGRELSRVSTLASMTPPYLTEHGPASEFDCGRVKAEYEKFRGFMDGDEPALRVAILEKINARMTASADELVTLAAAMAALAD